VVETHLWVISPFGPNNPKSKKYDVTVTFFPVNHLANDPLRVEIGMDVFILGLRTSGG
jgi:hypothetical protein